MSHGSMRPPDAVPCQFTRDIDSNSVSVYKLTQSKPRGTGRCPIDDDADRLQAVPVAMEAFLQVHNEANASTAVRVTGECTPHAHQVALELKSPPATSLLLGQLARYAMQHVNCVHARMGSGFESSGGRHVSPTHSACHVLRFRQLT